MHLLALTTLISLTLATPTPTNLVPRCGTTIEPSILQLISSNAATTVFGASQSVSIAKYSKPSNLQESTIVGFAGIPSSATACSLEVVFPANYPITRSPKNPQVNIYTFTPPTLSLPNDWSWTKVYNPGSPAQSYKGKSLFGTVGFESGMKRTINSAVCSENMGFLFEVADWEAGEMDVQFTQSFSSAGGFSAGVVLTHSC